MMVGNNRRGRRITRRGVTVGVASLAVGALAACGGEEAVPSPTAPPAPTLSPTPHVVAAPVPGYGDPGRWAGRTLAVGAWGGAHQDAQQVALFDPFMAATGAAIVLKNADLGRMRGQVEDGEVTFDLLTAPMEDALTLARTGFLEPIDYDVIDGSTLFEDVLLQHAVGAAYFSTLIVYAPSIGAAPTGWADFWRANPVADPKQAAAIDLRALRKGPLGTLEFALLADGVPLGDLYPLDLERAFANLDRLKRNVLVWYEDGKQPIELLLAGQVAAASAWNIRADQFNDAGQLRQVWHGGMLGADAWIVPQGAPNADLAMDFINYATRPGPSADFSRLLPYGPVNPGAFDLLPAERRRVLPSAPENKTLQFVQNWNWWADNAEEAGDRFTAWVIAEDHDAGSPAPED